MAYKYNERTGEFEDIPHNRTSTPSSQSSSTRTSSTSSNRDSKLGGCLGAIGVLLLQSLPYIIISALVAMCN